MKFEVKGMSELIDKLERYHEAPSKVGTKALKEAADQMLEVEKDTALKMHRKEKSTGKGAANLKVGRVKTYNSGSKFIGVGFTKEMLGNGENWKNVRGLYFQHYGYYNHRGGKYVAGSNWLGVAFENGHDRCYKTIKNYLLMELNKIG